MESTTLMKQFLGNAETVRDSIVKVINDDNRYETYVEDGITYRSAYVSLSVNIAMCSLSPMRKLEICTTNFGCKIKETVDRVVLSFVTRIPMELGGVKYLYDDVHGSEVFFKETPGFRTFNPETDLLRFQHAMNQIVNMLHVKLRSM